MSSNVESREGRSSRGDTGILVPVPSADTLVGAWRLPTAEPGLPPHVTLLYPFAPLAEIGDADRARLLEIAAGSGVATASFRTCGRFPGVSFLAPEQPRFFVDLTSQLVDQWPAYPAYGGAFDEIHPHLTIAEGLTEGEQDEIERALVDALPFEAPIAEAWLMSFDGARWCRELRMPFTSQ